MAYLEVIAKQIVKYVNKRNPRPSMKETLIIGLGNPGKRFEWTRHNLGWLVLDAMADVQDWNKHHKANALISKIELEGQPVALLKPQTFMNESGRAVREYLSYHKGNPDQIIVIHDDIDLDLGTMKIITSGGSAGHNGVQSIIKELKTQDFIRVRLGIRAKSIEKMPSDRFVLHAFSFFEKRTVKKWLPKIVNAIECLIKNDPEECMNRFH